MGLNMTYKEKYIQTYTIYLYRKYYLSRLFEEEYINKFADYEIENMQNIYEYMILDSKLSAGFMNFENININALDLYSKFEYNDLLNQINELKEKKLKNKENLVKLKKYKNEDIISILENIVIKANPNLNSTNISNKIWNQFIKELEFGNFDMIYKILERTKKLRVKPIKVDDLIYKDLYELTLKELNNIESNYPINLKNIILSKDNTEKKYKELELDIKKSELALNALQHMYLQMDKGYGLES